MRRRVRGFVSLLVAAAISVLGTPIPASSIPVPAQPAELAPSWTSRTDRIAGTNRIETASLISRASFPTTAPAVVLATGYNYPDALAGGPLAAAIGGPLLLTAPTALSSVTASEIARLRARKVIILGSTAAVGQFVEDTLRGKGLVVHRLAGSNRLDTAKLIAQEMAKLLGERSTVYIATGYNYPDALAVSSIAGARGTPILLTRQPSLPQESKDAILALGTTHAVILGGTTAVGSDIDRQLTDLGVSVDRLAGGTRYETACLIADQGLGDGIHGSTVLLAVGTNYPDALAGGVLGARRSGPLLLTGATALSDETQEWLGAHAAGIREVILLGGTPTIADSVRSTLESLLATRPYDAAPPSVSLTAPRSGAYLAGSVGLTASANDDVGVSKVVFAVGSSAVATDTTAPYDCELDTKSLPDGAATITATAYDTAGRTAVSAVGVVIDNTAPALSGLANLTTWREQDVTVSANVADANLTTVTCWWGQGRSTYPTRAVTMSGAGGVYSATIPGADLVDGTGTYFVEAVDRAGNVSRSPVSDAWYITNPRPGTPGSVELTATQSIVTVSWAPVSAPDLAHYEVLRATGMGSSVVGTTTATTITDTAVEAGTQYGYSVAAVDDCGNRSDPSPIKLVRVLPDSTPPQVALIGPAPGSFLRAVSSVVASASDDVALAGVTLLVRGVVAAEATTAPFAFSLDTADYADGEATLAVRARDRSGNTASAETTVIIDNTPPALSDPSIDATVALGADAALSVTASDANLTSVVCVFTPALSPAPLSLPMTLVSGRWAVAIPASLVGELPAAYYFRAADAAGNISFSPAGAPFATYHLTPVAPPDTTPPDAPASLTASASGDAIILSWSASISTDTASYGVWRATSATGFARIATVTGPGYTDTGINPGTTYHYCVAAVDAAGNVSGFSTEATASIAQRLTSIQLLAPTAVTAGRPFTVTLIALDQKGATLASYEGTVALAASGAGSLSPTESALVSGTCQLDLTYSGALGNITLFGTAGGVTGQISLYVNAPAEVARIELSPNPAVVGRFTNQVFTARGYTSLGNEVSFSPRWSVEGSPTVGSIDATTGVFTATRGGTGMIVATGDGVRGEATVTVCTYVSGTISEDTTWTVEGSPYVATETVTLPSAVVLSITQGVVVKMYAAGLFVAGVLDAHGSADDPVYFTSAYDDTVGGDLYWDPQELGPRPGQWHAILVDGAGTASLSNCVLRYGGSYPWGTQAAVSVYEPARLDMSSCVLAHNQVNAVSGYSAAYVKATGCYWGDPSGPRPIGKGDGVNYTTTSVPIDYGSSTYWQPVITLLVDVSGWVGSNRIAQGSLGSSVPWAAYAAEPVNVVLGNYTTDATDLTFGSRGPRTVISRSYNSLDTSSGVFGPGWSSSLDVALSFERSIEGTPEVVVRNEDGRRDRYTDTGDATLTPPPGIFASLVRNGDGSFILSRKDHSRLAFDAAGRLSAIADLNGNTTTLVRDGDGRVSAITDCVGRTTTVSYDASGQVAAVTDPISRTWTYSHDASGALTAVTDPASGVTTYIYDEHGHLTTIVDANGHYLVRNTYDETGRVVSQLDAKDATTTFAYYPSRITLVTDRRGATTRYTYDEAYRVTSVTDATNRTTSYTYDEFGNRDSVTDRRGYTTRSVFDASGNMLTTTDARANTTTRTYDALDDLTSVTDPLGNVTSMTYDTRGNLTSSTDASGATTTYINNLYGQPATIKDPLGWAAEITYDAFGDRESVTDPTGRSVTYGYDTLSRPTSVTDGLGNTTATSYDTLGRVVSITDALGHVVTTSYDAVGNAVSSADASGAVTSFAYGAKDELERTTDSLDGSATATCDADGNRTALTDPDGHTTTYAFDALDRLTSEIDPIGAVRSSAYDEEGNVISSTDALSRSSSFTYDELGRLTRAAYPDGTVDYAYDAAGRRISMTDSAGSWHYAYDAAGRLLSATDPADKSVSYTYDLRGQRRSMTYPDGRSVRYIYDPAGRLASLTGLDSKNTTFTYDMAGRLSRVARPNGANTDYGYDDAGHLTRIVERTGETTRTYLVYTCDAAGRRLAASEPSGTTSFAYDVLGRLTGVTYPGGRMTTYTYDAAGNRTQVSDTAVGTTSYTYDAADRLLAAGTTSYSWNVEGQLLGAGATTYGYDARGHLTAAGTGSYTYAGDGLRTTKTNGAGTTGYSWDAAGAVPLLAQAFGAEPGSFTFAQGLASQDLGGGLRYAHTDAIGSLRSVTDTSGSTGGAADYDAFGGGGGLASPFAFTGQQLDAESGLYYLRARYYDPATGRFTSRDTYGGDMHDTQSLNRYAYCGNDPVNTSDPTGMSPTLGGGAHLDYRYAPNPHTDRSLPQGYWTASTNWNAGGRRASWLPSVVSSSHCRWGEPDLGP